jgi:pimeloyl-ACP methyl ester carboxylesterase
VVLITAARHEGTIRVREGRQLGVAEFGPPDGRPVVWFHGTPGARRQIPEEARLIAAAEGIRIIGIDRPGIGLSTPHLYDALVDLVADVEIVVDRLGIERFSTIGLSGGGPYARAAGAVLGERVRSVGVLGGVAPTQGPDAIHGGLVSLATRFAPLLTHLREPLGITLTALMRLVKPFGQPMLKLYARTSPAGDRALLERPEFGAMFLDDLSTGGGRSMRAVIYDAILFTRHWGFDLAHVRQPVIWWHGDADHIIPFAHGEHCVPRLPDAELRVLHGESHLGGLGATHDILQSLVLAE